MTLYIGRKKHHKNYACFLDVIKAVTSKAVQANQKCAYIQPTPKETRTVMAS